jgi:hypothetical protein
MRRGLVRLVVLLVLAGYGYFFPISGKGTLDSGQTRFCDAAVNDWSDEETDNPPRGRSLRS